AIWRYESVGEFGENVEKARPWFLYLVNSFQLALPWTPLWIFDLWLAATRRLRPHNRRRLFAAGWMIFVIIVFSFMNVKKNAYLLPIMPAQCMLVADALLIVMRVRK